MFYFYVLLRSFIVAKKKIHKIYCLNHLLSVQFSSKVEYTHTVMQPDYEIFHL